MSFRGRTFQLRPMLTMSVVSAAVAQQPDQPSMPDYAADKTLADYL